MQGKESKRAPRAEAHSRANVEVAALDPAQQLPLAAGPVAARGGPSVVNHICAPPPRLLQPLGGTSTPLPPVCLAVLPHINWSEARGRTPRGEAGSRAAVGVTPILATAQRPPPASVSLYNNNSTRKDRQESEGGRTQGGSAQRRRCWSGSPRCAAAASAHAGRTPAPLSQKRDF